MSPCILQALWSLGAVFLELLLWVHEEVCPLFQALRDTLLMPPFSQASVISSFGAGFIGTCLDQILIDLCYVPVMAYHGDGGRN